MNNGSWLPVLRHCERMRSNPGVKILVLSAQRCCASLVANDVSFRYSIFSWIASHSLAMTKFFVEGRVVT
jgi:hypothetical protein